MMVWILPKNGAATNAHLDSREKRKRETHVNESCKIKTTKMVCMATSKEWSSRDFLNKCSPGLQQKKKKERETKKRSESILTDVVRIKC